MSDKRNAIERRERIRENMSDEGTKTIANKTYSALSISTHYLNPTTHSCTEVTISKIPDKSDELSRKKNKN